MGMTVQLSSSSAPSATEPLNRLSMAVYLCASSMVLICLMCLTWMACMTSTSWPKLYR